MLKLSLQTVFNRAIYFYSALLLLLLCISPQVFAVKNANTQNTDEKLSTVKEAINKQKSTIQLVNQNRKQLLDQLKNDELEIAKLIKQINQSNTELKTTQSRLTTLAKQNRELNKKKQQQENILAKQLRAAYSSGHYDYLKLILNQEKPASIQRTVTYYQYLNKARIKEIEQFKTTMNQIAQVVIEQQEQQAKIKLLKQTQTTQKKRLDQNRTKRTHTVAQLNKQLLNSKQHLEKLEAEEENLIAALNRINQLSKQEVNLNGLSQLRRQLSWPVRGKIMHSFGSKKRDYLKWKGVLIAASIGKEVKTIHNGTVLFSDWLKGYGLVTVIDHGKGYMSLYGHNQALLKSVGDRVETGEPIALAGQSGGQSQSALYFEIRHNGLAVNPRKWCK